LARWVGSAAMTDSQALIARVEDEAALTQLLAEVREHGGLVVEVPVGRSSSQFETVHISVVAPAGEIARVRAQLLQILGPGQAAVMLDEAGRAALLQTSLADQPAASLAAIQDVLDEVDEEEDDDDELPPDDGSTPRDLP